MEAYGAVAQPTQPVLEILDVHAGYGAVEVLRGVDLALEAGEIVAVVGANGAGKSTLLHVVAGHVRPDAGRILVKGRDATKTPAHRVLAGGVAFVHQGQSVFPQMTVEENLVMGGYTLGRRLRRQRVDEMLARFPVLADARAQRASGLSGGQRQILKLARALMVKPHTLLLDEPTAGLSPRAVLDFNALLVAETRRANVAALMVEQNLRNAFKISDRMAVLELGRFSHVGAPGDIRESGSLDRVVLGS